MGDPRTLIVLAAIALGSGCTAFLPPDRERPVVPDGTPRMSRGLLSKGRTVEARGDLGRGRMRATVVKLKLDDDEVMVKGTIEEVDAQRVVVGGVEFLRTSESEFVDAAGSAVRPAAIAMGSFVRTDGVVREDGLRLRKLEVRRRNPGELDEVQGRVDRVAGGGARLDVGPVRVDLDPDTPILWDVRGEEPPPEDALQDERLGFAPLHPALARVRRRDDEDWRPADQWRLDDLLTLGGETQYELEWRNNHDLQDQQERDRMIHDLSLKLEFAVDIDPRVAAFFQFRLGRPFVHFDQEADLSEGANFELGENFIILEDLPLPGVSFQIGRQDFDDGREWVMDDELDAVRLWLNLEPVVLELSASTVLFDTSPEEDGIVNYLLGAHVAPLDELTLFAYALHRQEGTMVDLDRTHVGLSAELEIDDTRAWLDVGYVTGQEGSLDLGAVGCDLMVSHAFRDLPLRPSLTAGFAYGSGDRDPFLDGDTNFRQTGLNDNSDRFHGVSSFRYLGELTRFELSNMIVLTAGIGFRPTPLASIDLVYHHYRQEYAFASIRDTRLRLQPEGFSKDLGHEVDLIIAIKDTRPLETKIILGYFQPGPAFRSDADDAWFLIFQVQFGF